MEGRGSRTKKLRGLGLACMTRLGEEAVPSAGGLLGLMGEAPELVLDLSLPCTAWSSAIASFDSTACDACSGCVLS